VLLFGVEPLLELLVPAGAVVPVDFVLVVLAYTTAEATPAVARLPRVTAVVIPTARRLPFLRMSIACPTCR
jgi:hypothetical protein